jgi:GT2 family glycosyltransferase
LAHSRGNWRRNDAVCVAVSEAWFGDDPRVRQAPCASIVVPTLDRPGYLEVTLASIARQAGRADVEVLVVSDGPNEPTARVTQRHGVRLIVLPERRGLNAARNAGIQAARSDLIVFIDDDVSAPEGWLDVMLAGARATPDREVFGGPIRPRLEGGQRGCGREPDPITALDAGPEDRDIELAWGTNMAVRRSAFERIGLFDESIHGRGDEEEWELRYARSGGRIHYLAKAGLDHRRTRSDARIRVLARDAYRQGRESRRHKLRSGTTGKISDEIRVLAGCAWHTVRRRCAYGIVMGARSTGSLREALVTGRHDGH